MRINVHPPELMPHQFWREVDLLSKSALMDLVWDLATTTYGEESDSEGIMEMLRGRITTIQRIRTEARK